MIKMSLALVAAGLLSACAGLQHNNVSAPPTPTTNVAFEGTPPARSFRFTYDVKVPAKSATDELELWIPIPVSTNEQEIADLSVEASRDYQVRDLVEGSGRSLHMSSVGEDLAVSVSFEVTRHATSGGGRATASELAGDLEANKLIPGGGKVSAMATALDTKGSPIEIAQALYNHTRDRMRYDKPAGGAWGRGDAEWACDSRFGNCTDFHSYFMGLARTKGIPTRFVMGFPIPAKESGTTKVGGYHCWAYFYDEVEGWRPVDISEADKHPEKAGFFFGNLDENRVEMIGGRDVLLDPAPAAGRLNLFIYPHLEINGTESRELTKSFWIENLD
jgi:transglutaminase-like putative cysteine protease